jgi:hypothetical protein
MAAKVPAIEAYGITATRPGHKTVSQYLCQLVFANILLHSCYFGAAFRSKCRRMEENPQFLQIKKDKQVFFFALFRPIYPFYSFYPIISPPFTSKI